MHAVGDTTWLRDAVAYFSPPNSSSPSASDWFTFVASIPIKRRYASSRDQLCGHRETDGEEIQPSQHVCISFSGSLAPGTRYQGVGSVPSDGPPFHQCSGRWSRTNCHSCTVGQIPTRAYCRDGSVRPPRSACDNFAQNVETPRSMGPRTTTALPPYCSFASSLTVFSALRLFVRTGRASVVLLFFDGVTTYEQRGGGIWASRAVTSRHSCRG